MLRELAGGMATLMDMFGEEPLKSLDEALQVLATENSLAACKKGMGAVKLFLEKVRGCCGWVVVVGGLGCLFACVKNTKRGVVGKGRFYVGLCMWLELESSLTCDR